MRYQAIDSETLVDMIDWASDCMYDDGSISTPRKVSAEAARRYTGLNYPGGIAAFERDNNTAAGNR